MLQLEPTCKPIAEVNIRGMTVIPVKTVTYVYATLQLLFPPLLFSVSRTMHASFLSLFPSLSACVSVCLSVSFSHSLSLSEDEFIRHKEKIITAVN